jgi:hypothetical protein
LLPLSLFVGVHSNDAFDYLKYFTCKMKHGWTLLQTKKREIRYNYHQGSTPGMNHAGV